MARKASELHLSDESYSYILMNMALGKLYHSKFRQVMTPQAYSEFGKTLGELRQIAGASIVGDFIMRLWNTNIPDGTDPQPVFPDSPLWVGIHYTFALSENGATMQSDKVIRPTDAHLQALMQPHASDATHVLTLADIDWPNLSIATSNPVSHNLN